MISPSKVEDLSACLSHSDTKTALAAESELAVLWGVSRVAHLDIEPALSSGRRPDAFSKDLFRSQGAVLEVRALSDDSFSGKEAMDRTANIVAGYADQLRKGAGKHLYFEFNERSYWTNRFHRERCVDPSFRISPSIEKQLKDWILAPEWPSPRAIRVIDDKTDVLVSWKQSTVRQFRTFCTMPSVAYDVEDNPIYKALKKKAKQIKAAPSGVLRCVFLVDAGCGLLRQLRPMGSGYEISGERIIRHSIAKLGIDLVIVLSPRRVRELHISFRSELKWNVCCFDRRYATLDDEYDRLKDLASLLPPPYFEGYQARDIHRQGGFTTGSRNSYLPTKVTTRNGGTMTIKLSAGLLLEYLAAQIDAEQFRKLAFSSTSNLFSLERVRGRSILECRLESGGIDEDDDYIVFELDYDLAKMAQNPEA